MTTFSWIIVGGVAMSALALVGSVTLVLPKRLFDRIVMPLVALAAGSLLGGALFHLLPEAIGALGNSLEVYGLLVLGFVVFLILEQYLHWHHHHGDHSGPEQHRPVGYLVLAADGLHNLIGGLAVGSAFVLDIRLGIVTWIVAAAHEIPQELGDFGLLVYSGWRRSRALLFNVLSAATFLVGALAAFVLSGAIDVAPFIPFAAGNFIYIAAADLIPEFTATPGAASKAVQTLMFLVGLAILFLVAAFAT